MMSHTKNLLFLHFMYKIYREIDDRYYNLTHSNHCTHEKKKSHAMKNMRIKKKIALKPQD